MGHETELEKQKLSELEKKLDLELNPITNLLEISKLYIEPFHQENKALNILSKVLIREPNNDLAKLLISFCYLHYLMEDKYLKLAVDLLQEIIDKNIELQGAAYLLLEETLDDLNKITDIESIKLLEFSIHFEENWVFNHQRIAWVFNRSGDKHNALLHIQKAIKNTSEMVQKPLSFIDEYIGGISYPKKYLEDDLMKIQNP